MYVEQQHAASDCGDRNRNEDEICEYRVTDTRGMTDTRCSYK